MFRTSSFLAIALGLTAIGCATLPATAKPSQLVKLQPLPERLPMPVASASKLQLKPLPAQLPAPGMQKPLPAKYPIPSPTPVKPGIDNVCPDNPFKCPPAGGGNGGAGGTKPPSTGGQKPTGGGAGPVVILAPQLPIQIPVPVSVSAPTSTVAAGTAFAQTTPSIKPTAGNCGDAIPALGAGIDQMLPTAQLSDADRTSVMVIRHLIDVLAANAKVASARDAEEVAMNTLSYKKVWLRCGAGTFTWATQDGASQ
jgi:hypothetical protein